MPTGPIVYGTEGTLVVERQGERRVVREARGGPEVKVHEAAPLPAGRATIAEELIHHLDTGEPLHTCLDAAFNLEAMAILDAGVRSAESGRLELVSREESQ